MHVNILNCAQRSILPALAKALDGSGLYLAGGTALALQVGHRSSIDYDWFGHQIGDPELLFQRLRTAGLKFTILSSTFETVYVEIETVQVSFIGYRYPLLLPANIWDEYGISLAALDDIACMKLSAITNRGSRKDFVDLHYLVTHYRSVQEYLTLFQQKFQQQDIGHVVRSLVYFDDAEQEPEIELLDKVDWQVLQQDFEFWVKAL